MTLLYQGQEIDISSLEAKIFDRNKNEWVTSNADISTAVEMEVYGMRVPVVNRDELIRHKKTFGRDVDKIDIDQLTRLSS
jgi:hypothetical protein